MSKEVLLRLGRDKGRLGVRARLAGQGKPGPGRAHQGRIGPGEGIQHRPVPALIQKAAIVLLPVQLHQRVRQCAQHLPGRAAVVHPGGLAPIRGVHPAQDQLALRRDPGFVQHRARGMGRGQIEYRRHLALRGAGAHKIGAPAPAQHETQTIKQDGLARPGFPGKHIQPRAEIQREPVDQQHIPDFERPKHPRPRKAPPQRSVKAIRP